MIRIHDNGLTPKAFSYLTTILKRIRDLGIEMHINALEIEPDALLETDICIIGSGPAGLALALGLKAHGRSAILLESGIDRYSETHQSQGYLDASYTFGNLQERQLDERRQIGGKSNAWSIESEQGVRGVRLLPYSAANFEARPAMGNVAWPFSRQALEPYYKMAADFFDIPYDGWEYDENLSPPLTGNKLSAMRFRFSDGEVLSRRIRDEIIPSEKIRLVSNATALNLGLDSDGGKVDLVRCESEPGRAFSVKARQVVLCGGALSTTALLLRSNDIHKEGIGNQHGLVGRYFMDHPLVDGGQLIVKDKTVFDRAGEYDLRHHDDGFTMAHLQMREAIIREESVANINAMLYPRPRLRNLSTPYQQSRRRAQKAWQTLKSPKATKLEKLAASATLVLHAGYIAEHLKAQKEEYNARINRGGWSLNPGASDRYKAFYVMHMCEQAPHFENRVKLGNDLDRFRQRRVSIDWKWTADDKAAVKRAQKLFAHNFSDGGWGEYQLQSDGGEPEIVQSSLGHHIGTTRMHIDPKQGVTDGNAKVNGIANLFISSSALFPSGGWENPTLTVAALSFRLADHLSPA